MADGKLLHFVKELTLLLEQQARKLVIFISGYANTFVPNLWIQVK
jgi:hypothetical protein